MHLGGDLPAVEHRVTDDGGRFERSPSSLPPSLGQRLFPARGQARPQLGRLEVMIARVRGVDDLAVPTGLFEVRDHVRENGVEIPYPQHVVHLSREA